jgi:hypothetical protein
VALILSKSLSTPSGRICRILAPAWMSNTFIDCNCLPRYACACFIIPPSSDMAILSQQTVGSREFMRVIGSYGGRDNGETPNMRLTTNSNSKTSEKGGRYWTVVLIVIKGN